ncbi:MAG: primosomal protein N' [Brevinematales bacterium]|nr:primosomal protein N' [Brevinematales bacterium]
MVAEVVLDLPIDKTFYYKIPDDIYVKPLSRVLVEFKNEEKIGIVLKILKEEEINVDFKIKEIIEIIDKYPIITEMHLEIAFMMKENYFCSLGEAFFSFVPTERKETPFNYNYQISKNAFKKLTEEQLNAFKMINRAIELSKNEVFLIHGVTGSGKTEVYKYLVKSAIEKGKSAILLVPEISLTPQNLERFYECFGDKVALYHSKMNKRERLYEWNRTLKGEAKIVIGPRSALFLPVKNPGIIILDEEHDASYKSNNSPRYHARDVARFRCMKENIPLVLGSATPQIETYYYALRKKFTLIELKNRFSVTLPAVEIIDLKPEKNKILSEKLLQNIITTLQNKKQVLLFLNRRGFAPVLMCSKCGYVFECPQCDVSFTYHKKELILNCHHCGNSMPAPQNCPSCGSVDIKEIGSGTEKLEEIITKIFPSYKVERMDLDTTRGKNSYFEILNKIKKHEVDIVIGTQMIAKGHDIGGIELVGVILPDVMLNIPDFRSGERTFSILTQVIGRAGRKGAKGMAFIQTYVPTHYSIECASKQDYHNFFLKELKRRKDFRYPPFVRLGRLVLRSEKKDKLEKLCEEIKSFILNNKKDFEKCEVLGPVSCPLEKLKNNYRYHIIIKSDKLINVKEAIGLINSYFKNSNFSNVVYMEIDIEPLSLI